MALKNSPVDWNYRHPETIQTLNKILAAKGFTDRKRVSKEEIEQVDLQDKDYTAIQ